MKLAEALRWFYVDNSLAEIRWPLRGCVDLAYVLCGPCVDVVCTLREHWRGIPQADLARTLRTL